MGSGEIERVELRMQERGACAHRGYHRVSEEPKGEKDKMICYDCGLWFTEKDVGKERYRVQPRD